MEFGFVPSGVVSDLKDIGNWKASLRMFWFSPLRARSPRCPGSTRLSLEFRRNLPTTTPLRLTPGLSARPQVRADAIERLRQAAGTLQTVRVVLPYLPELLNFLMGLVMDPNFKARADETAKTSSAALSRTTARDLSPAAPSADQFDGDADPGPAHWQAGPRRAAPPGHGHARAGRQAFRQQDRRAAGGREGERCELDVLKRQPSA